MYNIDVPKRPYTFMIDPDLAGNLKRLKKRDGIPESEQIRRALRTWFKRQGLSQSARKTSTRPK